MGKFFLCEDCLANFNIGKYYTKQGHCLRCGEKEKDGNYVTNDDIKNADKLGEDSVGVDWMSSLVTYNVAYPGTVCPNCGYYCIDRTKKEFLDEPDSARYKCNDCGRPLRIVNLHYTPPIKTEVELGKWVERHKAILRVGQTIKLPNRHTLRLCKDGRCVFFIDYKYKVRGKMLVASTCKTREVAVSKVVIKALLNEDGNGECKWRRR